MIISAGDIETFKFAVPTGIGLIETAINLTKICVEKTPKEILFVGSAGSYGLYDIFEMVESDSSSNIENSFFTNSSYTPIENIIYGTSDIVINSSNYITTDESVSPHYISRGIHLENMEFYSVLKVAQKFNIPAKGIFVVTNICNKNAHKDFVKNHRFAMEMLEKKF